MLETLLTFVIVLSVLVLIHELGHFLVAKKLGIKVEEFGFGFPPKVWGFRRGETLYTLNLLPIGGFVKLFGEDEAGAGRIGKTTAGKNAGDLKRAFFARPAWQRASVVVAGVVMNILLAAAIFYAMFSLTNFKTQLPQIGNYKFFLANQTTTTPIIIGEIQKDSPAQKAGIRPFSFLQSINGQEPKDIASFKKIVEQSKGKEVSLQLLDGNKFETYSVTATPREKYSQKEGALGIQIGEAPMAVSIISYDTPLQKVLSGLTYSLNLVAYNIIGFGHLISDAISKQNIAPVSDNVAGPIGIYQVFGQISQVPDLTSKIVGILSIAGLISVSLAFLNILPIPALDGGRLFLVVVEMLTGRKLSQKHEALVHAAGFFLLIFLMIVVTVKDIFRFF